MIHPKYQKGLISCLCLAMVLSGGCGNSGTDTGNPIVGLKIVGQQEIPSEKSQVQFQGTGVTVTDARIVLKEINLEPLLGCLLPEVPGSEVAEIEFEFVGPFVEDLLNNTSLPDIGSVPVPAGNYCEIELKFDKLDAELVPQGISPDDPIVGNALLIQGTRQDGTAFIVRLGEDDRFRLEGTHPIGFEISVGMSQFLVSFDLNNWFTGVDLNNALVSDEGIILLDSENNVALWTLLIDNVIKSARLFRDLDGDGVLDPNEEDPSLVLGAGVDEVD